MPVEASPWRQGGAESEAARPDAPDDIASRTPIVEIPDCDWADVRRLERELGLHPLVAQTLTRRGVTSTGEARAWIDGDEIREPATLPGAKQAADLIAMHLSRRSRIAVHGDYDVDGACSTAIMVRTLSSLGADVTWHVPSRFGDGYGLTRGSVERLVAADVQLIIAVDCGIGSVAEVAMARELGIDVVVCDHHSIGDALPEAAVVHPGLGGYPDPFLCAAAATYKLASLVSENAGGAGIEQEMPLVALATVCDVVPLRGENRALVRRGLEAMRSTRLPGLLELMRIAGVDPLTAGASSFGFALGPRINAAGRMHSAEPAVELLLTASRDRAAELAGQLGAANNRRRQVEQEITNLAEAQARLQRDRYAIVVAGEDWHPGVLGIVAGRLAERYRRPVVALGIKDGVAAGSGRGGGRYDLLGGLEQCAEMLSRFGGHRAAAGLELSAKDVDRFRRALAEEAATALTPDDLRPQLRVDAVGEVADISLETIAALEQIGPFGAGNPEPQILLAGSELLSVKRMGGGQNHFKLTVSGEGARASVVAFRQERAIAQVTMARPVDLVVELDRNQFRGREEARALLRGLVERADDVASLWRDEFEAALADGPLDQIWASVAATTAPSLQARDHSRAPLAVLAMEHAGSGARFAIAANDPLALRRGIGQSILFEGVDGAPDIFSYDDPRLFDGRYELLLMADPAPASVLAALGGLDAELVPAWSGPVAGAASAKGGEPMLLREHVVIAFRVIRDCGGAADSFVEPLREALPAPRLAARALRVLEEIELVQITGAGTSLTAIVAEDPGVKDLDQSRAFRSYSGYREESETWVRQSKAEIGTL